MNLNSWIAPLLAVVAACNSNDPSPPPEPPVISLQPSTQWSGGEIEVKSGAFVSPDLPVLVAGAETLAVRRVSDSVVAATVPLGGSGTVAIELAVGKKRYPAGDVDRVGFRSFTNVNPLFGTETQLTYDGTTPIVVGGSYTGTNNPPVQSLDLGTMQVTGYPGIRAVSPYGLGPTNHPNEFVVVDSVFQPSLWRLWPTLELIDTMPSTVRVGAVRQTSRVSDSVWIRTSHHETYSYRGTDAVQAVRTITMESPWAIVISPRGDRVALSLSSAMMGVPVYNALTGDTVFTLGPQFRTSYGGAGFSPDGDRIYFLGGPVGGDFGDSLISVNATTGQVLASAKVPPIGLPFRFATDPAKPLEYVEVIEGIQGHPTILVYDQNLNLLGRLPPPTEPAAITCGPTCPQGLIAVDRGRNLLHVFWNGAGAENRIWTFDLLP